MGVEDFAGLAVEGGVDAGEPEDELRGGEPDDAPVSSGLADALADFEVCLGGEVGADFGDRGGRRGYHFGDSYVWMRGCMTLRR